MKTRVTCVLFCVYYLCSFFFASNIFAATQWSQTDWSGGNGQANWADATKFSSSSGVLTSTSGQITLIPSSHWYNTNWSYRKKITIDHTKVSGSSSLSNFPVEISITNADLKSTGNGGKVAKSNGEDILFTKSDGTTKLNHEIESYSASGGILIAWVTLPTLSATTDTDVYLYYGNSTATDQQNSAAVWDANYKGVWHLKESPTNAAGEIKDSTGTGNNGTSLNMAAGEQTAGQIDGSLDFNGFANGVDLSSGYTDANSFTFSAWVRSDGNNAGNKIFSNGRSGGSSSGWSVGFGGSDGAYRFTKYGIVDAEVTSGSWSSDFTYVVWVVKANNDVEVYVNGVSAGSVGNTSTITTNASDARIGFNRDSTNSSGDYWNGLIDEVRYSNTIRSSDWIATEYNNQNSPSTFASVSSEQTFYGTTLSTLTSSIFDTAGNDSFGKVTFTKVTPSNTSVNVKVRSSNDNSMNGAADFSTCTSIVSGDNASTGSCVTDGERYIQYQILLSSSDGLTSPTLQYIAIDYTPSTVSSPSPLPDAITASDNSSPSSCGKESPSETPNLFQINVQDNQATLYFSPLTSLVNKYTISYGLSPNDERFGVETNQGVSSGVLFYTINYLSPGTTYYFKIRGVNECMPGRWGNEMKITTLKNATATKIYYKNFLTQILSFLPTKKTEVSTLPDLKNACAYTVSSGDTLWGIAVAKNGRGSTYNEIMKKNNLKSTHLHIGQKLVLPC